MIRIAKDIYIFFNYEFKALVLLHKPYVKNNRVWPTYNNPLYNYIYKNIQIFKIQEDETTQMRIII